MGIRSPFTNDDQPDRLNEHLHDPGDPDGLVAAEKERLWRAGQVASPPPTSHAIVHKRYWPKLGTVALVVLAIVGAYFLGFHKASVPATKKAQAEQNKTERKLAPPTTVTKHYESTTYKISIDYPDNWIVSDTAAKLTVTSPTFAMTDLDGATEGHVVYSLQNQQSSIAGYPGGGAIANLASEKIAYKQPSNIQRTQSYLTLAGYHSTNGLDALFLTGDAAYDTGQNVLMSDIVKGDPLVGVQFVKCTKSYCAGGSITPITLRADSWEKAVFHAQVVNLLQSLVILP